MACMIRGEIRRSWLTWIGGRGAEALYFQQVPPFLGGGWYFLSPYLGRRALGTRVRYLTRALVCVRGRASRSMRWLSHQARGPASLCADFTACAMPCGDDAAVGLCCCCCCCSYRSRLC